MDKINVVLAGEYPPGSFEIMRSLLPPEEFQITAAGTREAYAATKDAEIMILRVFKAAKEDIERNPKLRMIMRWGTGFDTVDIVFAGQRGVWVTNTPGANAGAVSELSVMLMLAVYRNLLRHIRSMEKGIWSKSLYEGTSFCLKGKTVGLLGGGSIGCQVAAKLRAFEAAVKYYDPLRLEPETEIGLGMEFLSKDELIRSSDIISLHLPLTGQTRHYIGAEEIARMKSGAVIINTARGPLVDNDALLAAVREGRLLGAGLDVTEREPLGEDDPLLNTPGIIVTPHIGGATADLREAIAPILAQDILDFVKGRPVRHVVNKEHVKA